MPYQLSGVFEVMSLWHKRADIRVTLIPPMIDSFHVCPPKESLYAFVVLISDQWSVEVCLMLTQSGQVRRLEKIFWMMTLLARNMVIITLTTISTLAHTGWGLSPMNWGSLMQMSSRLERKGRR